jgi:hypothetical protein
MEQRAQSQPVKPVAVDRLRAYLRQLSPGAQAMLMGEFERALTRGDDIFVANLVLDELRRITRVRETNERRRILEPARLVFACLEPFLVDDRELKPGQIRRSSLEPIWVWLCQTAISDEIQEFDRTLAVNEAQPPDRAVRNVQAAAVRAIFEATSPSSRGGERSRSLIRVGSLSAVEDLQTIGLAIAHRDALEIFQARLPKIMRAFGDTQVASIRGQLNQLPILQKPEILPLTLWLIMQRLTSPWQLVRLAISVVGSDEESRIAGTPFGVAITMALYSLARLVEDLRSDIKRGRFDKCAHHLKPLHDGLRDLRTELDIRSDSHLSRQLVAIRTDVSNVLKSEIESVPGRVRRLLRQRSDKDISAGAKLDPAEIDETAALIDFVATCRSYAGELAINEVTLRSFSDLQHYVESSTETLVESLRSGEPRARAFRQLQTEAAIRFCELIFGHDYASLMNKAAEVALTGERKAPKAS